MAYLNELQRHEGESQGQSEGRAKSKAKYLDSMTLTISIDSLELAGQC